MKKITRSLLSLVLAAALLFGMASVTTFAAGGKEPDKPISAPAEAADGYTVTAAYGSITTADGSDATMPVAENTVLVITLDESAFPGKTFDCWVSSDGTKVPQESFRLMVDQDAWFYPTFTDLSGVFGDWEVLIDGNCEQGKLYQRTDPDTGLVEYKKVYVNYGMHDFSQYEYIDEETCRPVCRLCGYEGEPQEHQGNSPEVIVEATHEHDGLKRFTCYNCGRSVDTVIPRGEEHVWDATVGSSSNWEIIQESKDGQPGIHRRHCLYCDAYEDCWYIKAEWEKYYYGNRIYFDSSDSMGLWGVDDELHYNFVNDEGYDTYVYAVREDGQDSYQAWAYMWIDHADALGRKPLYVAKADGRSGGSSVTAPSFDWAVVEYLDTPEDFIKEIDSIRCGYERYSSSMFDLFKVYEKLYNDGMFPIDSSPDFTDHYSYWQNELGEGNLNKDYYTGIDYYSLRWDDGRQTLHIDPKTNVCISNFEPNVSSHHSYLKGISKIVRPDEYQAISEAFTPDTATVYPEIDYPEVQETEEGHEHYAEAWDTGIWLAEDEQYHVSFCACGEPIRRTHSRSGEIFFDLNDPQSSHIKYTCECGYIWEDKLNLTSTADISDDIYNTFTAKHWATQLRVNVLTTPEALNFQLRVNPYYATDGPLKDDDMNNRFLWHGCEVPWTYGYYKTDWYDYGVVRTQSSPYNYYNYGGPTRYSVTLQYWDYADYEFDCWEIYDWASGEWVFFSDEKEPVINTVDYEVGDEYPYTPAEDAAFTMDTRLKDLTMLRCVRTYTGSDDPAGMAHITVTGGTAYPSTSPYYDRAAEWSVPAGTMVYFECDYSQIPQGKQFSGWREVKDGEVLAECGNFYGITVESGEYEISAVYEDARYYFNTSAENGTVYLVGGDGGGKVGDADEFYGGEFTIGTTLTLTTVGYEDYPYFYGWYFRSWKGEDGSGNVELLSTDTTLVYTIEGEIEGDIVAKWGNTEEAPKEYHDITVINGFAFKTGMHEGVRVSAIRAGFDISLQFCPDRTCGLDIEGYRAEGTLDDGTAYDEDYSDPYWGMWLGDNTVQPGRFTVTGYGAAHTHDLILNKATAATCDANGNIDYYYCDGCGKYFLDEAGEQEVSSTEVTIPATGHDWDEGQVTTEATCGRRGVITYTCKNDPTHTRTESIPATGKHTWGEWEVTKEATETETGEKTRTCSVCGQTDTEEIPMKEHVDTRIELGEVAVTDALADAGYETAEEIGEAMVSAAVAEGDFTTENTAVYEVTLMMSSDGGQTWTPVSSENMPEDGLTITFDYPEGTDAAHYDFIVVHMFSENGDGHIAGDTEILTPTKTEDGLAVTVTGLSPFAVAWVKTADTAAPTANRADGAVVKKYDRLILSCADEDAVIYYTLDGSDPAEESSGRMTYDGMIAVSEDLQISMVAYTPGGGYSSTVTMSLTVGDEIADILGDADGDGTVTIFDATTIQRYLAKYDIEDPDRVTRCGCVTGEKLTIFDVTFIQRYLAKLSSVDGINMLME